MSKIAGIASSTSKAEYCVKLDLIINNVKVAVPVIIVKNINLPCCIILGIEFCKENEVCLDFGNNVMHVKNLNVNFQKSTRHDFTCAFIGNLFPLEETNNHFNIKFNVSPDSLMYMQNNNFAIKQLRSKIVNNIDVNEWNNKLSQFKRYRNDLRIENDLLVKLTDGVSVPVVSFPFLVELVFQVHNNLSHVGTHKLIYTIKKLIWHPSIIKVVSEICRCCIYCQKNKINVQYNNPPVLKVNAEQPFNLLCIDLLQFPRSPKGHVAVLVAVDHFSKWLVVTPVKK